MSEKNVLVVGAGIAGLSAATVLAKNKISVRLVDQAGSIGGNLHRQANPNVQPISRSPENKKRWKRVIEKFNAEQDYISVNCRVRFSGIDQKGVALLSDLNGTDNKFIKPDAVIIATGASERVIPRPGWTLANVRTLGSIQTELKTTSQAPKGKIIIAGSGPFLIAAGAELCKAGNPPKAIIEGGYPYSHILKSLRLPPSYLREAFDYMQTLIRARVPIYYKSHIREIKTTSDNQALEVCIASSDGKTRTQEIDYVGLHDGLRQNDYGFSIDPHLKIFTTGDCRELLGGRAAEFDGKKVGLEVASLLTNQSIPYHHKREYEKHRQAQNIIRKIYAHEPPLDLQKMDEQTVICRCENKTINDLKKLSNPTIREMRLLGRFSMGACQGRFCSEWVQRFLNPDTSPPKSTLGLSRWPVLPTRIHNIVEATTESTSQSNSLIQENK